MTEQEAFDILATRFDTQWASETEVAWPDKLYEPTAGTEYVKFDAFLNLGFDDSLGPVGGRRYEYLGIIMVQVYTPKGKSGTRNRFLTNKVLEAFRGQNLTGILPYNGRVNEVGEDGTFFQRNVIFDYRYDHIA